MENLLFIDTMVIPSIYIREEQFMEAMMALNIFSSLNEKLLLL